MRPTRSPFLKAGKTWKLKIRGQEDVSGQECLENPTVVVSDLAAAPSVDEAPDDRGRGKFRIALLDLPGGGRVDITTCGKTRTWHLVNLGPKGALDDPISPIEPPASLSYDEPAPSYRVGDPITDNTASLGGGGAPTAFSIAPQAPDGLTFDAATGTLSGTPETAAFSSPFTITASNDSGQTEAVLSIQVTPETPDGVEFLEAGFVIEQLHSGLDVPVKLAFLPDGRLLFNELLNGRTRVIASDGTLLTTPFATTTVNTGGEQGLLGLAVSPTFESDGHVFVLATVPADGPQPIRNQVIRYTATGDTGGSPTVILDDIPAATIHNAGDLQFGPVDGKLYVSTGDAEDEDNSQTDGRLAGKILRINADGTVPGDNPVPGDPEWCRGLRNTFDMAFHPVTDGLFGSENGPTFGDEINFLARDKNFGWGPVPPDLPAFKLGVRVIDWTPVIVPTGVLFLEGAGFPADFEDDLLVLEYDEAGIRRLQLSGSSKIDLDAQVPFVDLDDSGSVDNKPLDAVEAPDGSLWFSTFGGLWRVAPYETP